MYYLFFIAFFTASSIFSMETLIAEPEIIKINPPNLDEDHLGKRVICFRPMRTGAPKIKVKEKDDKVIVHNYGHGGSGLTLAPGAAAYANSMLESSYSSDLNKDGTEITIIGAGVLGLFSAYDLHRRGYRKITIVADKFTDLTSHNAGGLVAPVSMDNKPKKQPIINKIGADSYEFYKSIAAKNHPDFMEGAYAIPAYFENRKDSGLEPYVEQKVMKEAKDVILDFKNGTQRKMVAYDGIFIDTSKMMNGLTEYLKPYVKFVQKKVKTFSEIKSKYIINCAGMGSKELANDNNLISVQGHLVMLRDQVMSDLQYMILIYFPGEKRNEWGQKVTRSFYIFPKPVIGGTFIEGATKDTPNMQEFENVVRGAHEFFGLKWQ